MTAAQLRTAGLHAGTALSASVATAMWLSTKSVDLYALLDQFNAIIADVTKFTASLSAVATGAWAVYKATTANKLIDIQKDADFKGAVVTPELAAAVPGMKVVSTTAALPEAAQNAKGAQ